MTVSVKTCESAPEMTKDESTEVYRRLARLRFVLLLGLAIASFSCGGSLYKVKPAVQAPGLPPTMGTASAGGLRLHAAPLVADEESQTLFEANLPLAGLLPVRVELTNESGAPLSFKRIRFRLRDQSGKEWKYRTPHQTASRILEANAITLYNPNSREAFETALTAHSLDLQTPLAANEPRRGLIFFQTLRKEPVESPRGLTLVVEGLAQSLELRLN